jgi:hypothetical protein
MAKQQILFKKPGKNRAGQEAYIVKLPKILTDVRSFEMQFGMKQPSQYRTSATSLRTEGIDSKELRGFTDTVSI